MLQWCLVVLIVLGTIREARAGVFEGLEGRAALYELVARLDDGRCGTDERLQMQSALLDAPQGSAGHADLLVLEAMLNDCVVGDEQAAQSARGAAAVSAVWRAAPLWWGGTEDPATTPWRGGPTLLELVSPDPGTRLQPSRHLVVDYERWRWRSIARPAERIGDRLTWIAESTLSSQRIELLRDVLRDVDGRGYLRDHPEAFDIAMDVAADAAWRGDVPTAIGLVEDFAAIGAIRQAEARQLSELWRLLDRLSAHRAEVRELDRLITGEGVVSAEAMWATLTAARKDDRDDEAFALVTEYLARFPGHRRVAALEACIHLAGWTSNNAVQSQCWLQRVRAPGFASRAHLDALAIEVAVDAWSIGNLEAASSVLDAWGGPETASVPIAYWRARVAAAESEQPSAEHCAAFGEVAERAPLSWYGIWADRWLAGCPGGSKFDARVRTLWQNRDRTTLLEREPVARLLAMGFSRFAHRLARWGGQLAGGVAFDAVAVAAMSHERRGENSTALWLLGRHVDWREVSWEQATRAPGAVWRLGWPMPFDKAFAAGEHGSGIRMGVLRAFARRESSFDPDAVSYVGARGLMQVRPATAAEATGRAGWTSPPSRRDLLDPEVNVRAGGIVLRELFERYGPDIEHVAVAYASGPAHVRRWSQQGLPADVWLERMPYPTVRAYAQDVAVAAAIYEALSNR
ncbi:MAG: hypothetical protein ACJA1R_001890 [Flavobacteriales bacterium]|jgi:hypothetical protein